MAHDEAYKIAERQIQQALRLHETRLSLNGIGLSELPESIGQLAHLTDLHLGSEYVGDFFVKQYNHLTALPPSITQLEHLEYLNLEYNRLTTLPPSLAQLEHLEYLNLDGNPLNPALQSAYDACKKGYGGKHKDYEPLWAYLRSLEGNAESLYEAKLVLVGEGNVGKTTLLKALKSEKGEGAPKKDERTTHGVEIDIHGLKLPHPEKEGIEIKLNA